MAELTNTAAARHNDGGKVRSKRTATRVDLTAMVDLAFLLITFFILTTTLQKPKSMLLIMPDKSVENAHEPFPASRTMTILLGSGNKVEWYIGEPDKPLTPPSVTNFSAAGIRKDLLQQGARIRQQQGKEMLVLIKPAEHSKYANVVGIMDELDIIGNKTRAIVDITPAEVGLLKREGIYN